MAKTPCSLAYKKKKTKNKKQQQQKTRKENFMLPMKGAQILSLVRELRFHKLEIRVRM